jgi:hypothetical protein
VLHVQHGVWLSTPDKKVCDVVSELYGGVPTVPMTIGVSTYPVQPAAAPGSGLNATNTTPVPKKRNIILLSTILFSSILVLAPCGSKPSHR